MANPRHPLPRAIVRRLVREGARARVRGHALVDPWRRQRCRRAGAHLVGTQVAILLPFIGDGGAERLLLDTAAGLASRGCSIAVVTTEPVFDRHRNEVSPDVVVVRLPELALPCQTARLCARLLVDCNPDSVLVSQTLVGYRAVALARRWGWRGRSVDVLHAMGRPADDGYFVRLASRFREDLSARIVISKALRDVAMQRGFLLDTETVTVIPNAPSPRRVAPATLRPERPVILWMGRVEEDKSPLDLVDVLLRVRERVDARLIVAGEGSLRRDLQQQLGRVGLLPHVEMAGHVSDVTTLLFSATVLVNTSPEEGQPLAVLEALASGLTVCAYAVGGMPEMAERWSRLCLVPRAAGSKGLAEATTNALLQACEPSPTDVEAIWAGHLDAYSRALALEHDD